MRRLLRDIAEGRELGDVTTLGDPSILHGLQEKAAARAATPRSGQADHEWVGPPRLERGTPELRPRRHPSDGTGPARVHHGPCPGPRRARRRHLRIAAPRPASSDVLQLVHDPAYVAAVRGAVPDDSALHDAFGLGGEDNPIFEGMHEASALVTGATMDAAIAVRTGEALHAVNLAGGLHHAMPARASGFCVYNDAAVAIAWLLADGVQRVAYIDLDAHHGDGVEAAFYGDPRVLTISLHESGYTAFPGTGFPDDSGHGAAEGHAVNVALPPGTGDAAGCARSTPSCRRSCGPSSRRSCSPNSAATPTASIRWPSSTTKLPQQRIRLKIDKFRRRPLAVKDKPGMNNEPAQVKTQSSTLNHNTHPYKENPSVNAGLGLHCI